MRNDDRLIPFLGGLVIGGVGGAAVENNKYPYYNNGYFNQQPYYNYPPQQFYNYNPYAYNTQILPTNSMQYPQYNNIPYNTVGNDVITGKIVNEEPLPLVVNGDSRNNEDISYVPRFRP